MSDKMATSPPKKGPALLENEDKMASSSQEEDLETVEYDTEENSEHESEDDNDPVAAAMALDIYPMAPLTRDYNSVCNKRIAKELQNLTSENGSCEGRNFSIEYDDSNIREWYVHINKLIRKCPLKDKMSGPIPTVRNITFKVFFTDHYPNYPPIVGLLEPSILNKYITTWGRNCLKILQPEHWQSRYTMELVIMHLIQVLQLRNVEILPYCKVHHESTKEAFQAKASTINALLHESAEE